MKYRLVSALFAFFLMPINGHANGGEFGQQCHIEIDVLAKRDVVETLDHNFKEVRFAISKCPAVIAKANSLTSKHKYISENVVSGGVLANYLMFRDDFFQYSPALHNGLFWTTDNKKVYTDRALKYHYDEREFGYQHSFSTRGMMSTPIGYRWEPTHHSEYNEVDQRKIFPNRLLNSVVLEENYMFFSDLVSNAQLFQLINMLERGNYQVIFSVGEDSVVNQ